MVFLIPLRDVTNNQSIGGIVKTYLSDSNPAKPYQIDDYISRNQSKILIIFDGFDEFNGKLSGKDSSEVIHILRMEQYKSCKVIVTTRPWRTDEFVMEKELADAYTFLNVEGFNTDNLSAYIKRYFRIREKNNRAESLISFMEENEVIRANMAPFPIYCAMLCLMWNDCSEEKQEKMQELKTFSKIFGEMISFLKEHFASKTCGNLQNQNVVEQLKKAHRAIQDISEIALNGLLDRNLSFPEEQFRECHDAMETCCSVGVLTTETDVIPRKRRRDVNISSFVASTVSFPHKLFQEYIAALYIENLFANDRPKYDKVKSECLSRRQEFRYLLYFTSALGNELGLDIIHGLIDSAPHVAKDRTPQAYQMESDDRRYRDFCVDVAFECHTEEAARTVGQRWKKYDLASHWSGYEHTNSTFEHHTKEAARVVGERQKKYQLSSYSPEHTNSGVAFMMRFNQVVSD
ncbi:NACHT, LRR and PYD domains-containing protein 3-like [Diadema antillarum]|uniref:NACHT, LRR and PYD domains-containing protein 3-like n=1 Tax=Diadema antillarum TaxID=105358 RepID=UPI003A8658E2